MYSILTQELNFSTSELQSLPSLVGGFFVLTCYATDEIAQAQRLLIAVNPNQSEHKVTGIFAITQINSALRILGSRLIEYDRALRDLAKKARAAENELIVSFIDERAEEYRKIRKGTGFKLAQYLRDKLTAHYSIEHAIRSLKERDSKQLHSIFPAETYINSQYLLGEEIFFLDAFSHPDVVGDNFKGTFEEVRNLWMTWISDATLAAQRAHTDFITLVYNNHFPDKKYSRVFMELDKQTQIGIIDESRIPMWWQRDK